MQKCTYVEDQFVSPTFLVPKPDGTSRFIFNLKKLNEFIDPVHFKLEDGRTVYRVLFQNCSMATLDLKDAYYSIPFHENHRKYLRFYYNGQLYEFECLPFGLYTAPYVFTKTMKPVVSFLRKRAITMVTYIDDILFIEKSDRACRSNLEIAKSLFEYLGLLVNLEKSQISPQKLFKFLGFIYDSAKIEVKLPQFKKVKIQCLVKAFKLGEKSRILKFAKMLGFLVSCFPAVNYGPVHTKACERLKFKALRKIMRTTMRN